MAMSEATSVCNDTDPPKLSQLLRELSEVEWDHLAIALGLSTGDMRAICRRNQYSGEDIWKATALENWFKSTPDASLSGLLTVLRKSKEYPDLQRAVDRMESKHMRPGALLSKVAIKDEQQTFETQRQDQDELNAKLKEEIGRLKMKVQQLQSAYQKNAQIEQVQKHNRYLIKRNKWLEKKYKEFCTVTRQREHYSVSSLFLYFGVIVLVTQASLRTCMDYNKEGLSVNNTYLEKRLNLCNMTLMDLKGYHEKCLAHLEERVSSTRIESEIRSLHTLTNVLKSWYEIRVSILERRNRLLSQNIEDSTNRLEECNIKLQEARTENRKCKENLTHLSKDSTNRLEECNIKLQEARTENGKCKENLIHLSKQNWEENREYLKKFIERTDSCYDLLSSTYCTCKPKS